MADFFPLTCDYRERTAAAGKFPGGFMKREGRPTTKETLTSRLMDRPIRPLFPEWFQDEVQIQAFVLASDRQNDADVLAMIGASAALGLSPLPFQGPIGSVRLGQVDGQFVPFPTQDELEESDLDLIVSGSQRSGADDRGLCPRDARGRDARGDHEVAHGWSRKSASCRTNCSPRSSRREEAVRSARPRTALYDKLQGQVLRRLQGGQADRRASTPGPMPSRRSRQRAKAELIPDPAAAGAITRSMPSPRPGIDLEEHVVRDLILSGTRPDGRDHKIAAGDRLPRRRAAPRARLGPVPAGRDAGPDHRSRWAPAATSSGSTG